MTTIDTLADALAEQYDADPTAARSRVEHLADRLPAGMYDPANDAVTGDGEAQIRDQFAADYHGATPVAERHDSLLDGIREADHLATDHRRQADEWATRRDELIRRAVRGGVRVADVAAAAGISRERIYQIRDSRR